ncbi:dITP/XTP pyrophosphatase [Tenacibaculum litopenaei]|uniref:non-canonical purine NTP diphosphatase n=1 Tax=Tenacibaculum litopenaei TaxID=396016 RepID=UPI003893812B
MKLVFATNNLNKLAEVQQMLPDSIELVSLKDIGCYEDIPETATTLEGNAQIKANHITETYGYNCFADDTGLEVEALNGAPGVYSARYAGEPSNADNNMDKLLHALNNASTRAAQFRTAICLNLNGEQFLFEGVCTGEILSEREGAKGFGYDPIFKPTGHPRSFANMTAAEKNAISHRGLAIQKLVNFLKAL